jgi:hypothetical protein
MSTNLASLSDERLRFLWPQAAGELRGFAIALARGDSGLTAAQLRLAIEMADEYYRQRINSDRMAPGEEDRR